MRTSSRRVLAVTTALIGFSAVAVAAPEGDPAAPAQANASVSSRNGNVMVRTEQRLADLHAKLQITPAQEPQWSKFAQAMRDNGRKMDETFQDRVQSLASMNAMDNMKSYAKISMQHARNVENLVPVFDALYSSMSESQKRTADQVFREDANRGGQG